MKPIQEPQKYYVGQNLDIKDSVGKWINGQVLLATADKIYIHYSGWSSKYDEQITINSDRILPQWQPGKKIQLNNRIDAYHPIGGWLEARVIGIQENTADRCFVKVHYFNYHFKYDRVVDLGDAAQVAIIGAKSKAFGIGKKRAKILANKANIAEMIKKLLEERSKTLKQKLEQKNLTIKKSQGDGNCLFRSVSDQLYGNQMHFEGIRRICMDYIEHEKQFFSDYVTVDMEEYIERKRKDGEWGDDVQIQALSEIYGRPIQIYAFDSLPIRTFHQQNPDHVNPIRLAYVGSCHYDSVKQIGKIDDGIMNSEFGNFQNLFSQTYIQGSKDMVRVDRNAFSYSTRIQESIEEQLLAQNRDQVKMQDQLSKALEASQTEALISEIQESELKAAIIKQEQQRLQQQLKKIEQQYIQEAKKQSSKQSQSKQKPYWFDSIKSLGYTDDQIWFAIGVNGYDPDAVQNFLLDNHDL